MSDLNLTINEDSDIYLAITETPAVVSISSPLIASANVSVTVGTSVTVANFPAVTTVAGTVTANDPSLITRSAIVVDTGKFIRPVAGRVSGGGISSSYEPIKVDENGVVAISGTVSLDSASLVALENITVTVGSSVSVSNFPATQTIAGTVTANIGPNTAELRNEFGYYPVEIANTSTTVPVSGTVTANLGEPATGVNTFISESGSTSPVYAVGIGYNTANDTEFLAVNDTGNNFPVAVNNSVTISSLPAISGTVTASNLPTLNYDDNVVTSVVAVKIANDLGAILGSNPLPSLGYGANVNGGYNALAVANYGESFLADSTRLGVQLLGTTGEAVGEGSSPLLVSGTVTANAVFAVDSFAGSISSDDGGNPPDYAVQIGFTDGTEFKHISPSAALPISGTVTANVIGLNHDDGLNPVQLPIRDDFDGTPFVVVGPSTSPEPFPVSGTVTVGNVEGWGIPLHDYRSFSYSGGNLSTIAYKTGGASGTTVGILTLAYDGSGNLTSMTKS